MSFRVNSISFIYLEHCAGDCFRKVIRMRLSESLRRGVMKTFAGGMLNRFRIKSRRSTLFFEDILAEYIKICEQHGHAEAIKSMSWEWALKCVHNFLPSSLERMPLTLSLPLLSRILKSVWINIGLMEHFDLSFNQKIIEIETRNESITRIIGGNNFICGLYMGGLSAISGHCIRNMRSVRNGKSNKYVFEMLEEPCVITSKLKRIYDALNSSPILEGFTFKDALKSGVFRLKENSRIYFRGKSVIPVENTIFHIFGNRRILLDEVPNISFNYFNELIEKYSSNEQKLALLKTLLQSMGWGIMKIMTQDCDKITVEIKNPPYGLQLEPDTWEFLSRVILGYLWLLNKNLAIAATDYDHVHRKLELKFKTN